MEDPKNFLTSGSAMSSLSEPAIKKAKIDLKDEVEEGKEYSVSKHGYKIYKYHGVSYPGMLNATTIDDLRARFELKSTDIVIATFPKCGTTWMQQIVLMLLAGGDRSKVQEPMAMAPWMEWMVSAADKSVAQSSDPDLPKTGMPFDEWTSWSLPEKYFAPNMKHRRVIKSHAPVQLAPWKGGVGSGLTDGSKVIIVTRNPKDTAVSMLHHSLDVPFFKYDGDFADFLDTIFLKGENESGCFWNWHAGWWKAYQKHQEKASQNIFWTSYEELKQNPAKTIRKIADFCDIEASDVVIEAVATGTDFKKMQEQFDKIDKEKLAKGQRVKNNHIRQGLSGAWKKTFTVAQNETMDFHHTKLCQDLGLPLDLFQF